VRAIVLANGWRVEFGTEPDTSLRDANGALQVAIEVKAGLDPAGAQERYGAAKKSFEKAFDENTSVETIYVAGALTPAVLDRIKSDRTVRRHYDLSRLLSSEEYRGSSSPSSSTFSASELGAPVSRAVGAVGLPRRRAVGVHPAAGEGRPRAAGGAGTG